ncbi:MAG: iron chaperone, partial [Candidatus Nanopelagicaceae bacterium]
MQSEKQEFESQLKKFPKTQQKALLETLKTAEQLFPKAERAIAWGMPTLEIGADNLCHVMGFKNHNSFFPSSGAISTQFKKDLEKFVVSKG